VSGGKQIVLAVVAHPDDEVLGVGATLAKHCAAGDEVHVVICASCRVEYVPGNRMSLLPMLSDESRAVARVLDVKSVVHLGHSAHEITGNRLLNDGIECAMELHHPDVVYTHHWGDLNSDHRAVCEAVAVACRPQGEYTPSRVLCFETPSSSEWAPPQIGSAFVPNVFVDVEATIDTKLNAMGCYADELRDEPHPRNLDSLHVRARAWGQHAGLLYAEPFALLREIVR